jgi:hypothetical protein
LLGSDNNPPQEFPEVPRGTVPASGFTELENPDEPSAILCAALYGDYEADDELSFYTFSDGEWRRLMDVQLRQGGIVAEGAFTELPENLAVLKPLRDVR